MNKNNNQCKCNEERVILNASDEALNEEQHECCHGKDNDCKCNKDNKLQEEVTKLQAEVAKLQDENLELINKVKLAQAELVNYRKRKDEETANILKYANKDLIMELIDLVDNFERAIKVEEGEISPEVSKFLTGFKMMYATLKDILNKFGVVEINRAGEIFDPTLEQALLTDHVDGMEDEAVIEVLLKGYKLKDRVIRPASVKINQN